MAPSIGENGKPYVQISAPEAASWVHETVGSMVKKLSEEPLEKPQAKPMGKTSPYGEKAMLYEMRILRNTPNGQRNDQLNKTAFALGQLIAGTEIDETEALTMLTSTAKACGLNTSEIPATIDSGKRSGKKYSEARLHENTTAERTSNTFSMMNVSQQGNKVSRRKQWKRQKQAVSM